jgi:hypothetical protein
MRSSAVTGPSSWNVLPIALRLPSFSSDMFAKHFTTQLFGLAYSRQDKGRILKFVLHFVGHDTVTVLTESFVATK